MDSYEPKTRAIKNIKDASGIVFDSFPDRDEIHIDTQRLREWKRGVIKDYVIMETESW